MNRLHFNRYDGERLPKNAKLVTRPSRWGNPYKVEQYGRTEALNKYKTWLNNQLQENPEFLKPLEGKDLACSCRLGEPCHADILLNYIKNQ